MNAPPEPAWLNPLLDALQWTQLGLLQLLHAVGLAGDAHGQPAWPWAWRLAGENLRTDLGQARRLALTLALAALALLLALAAAAWRRRRLPLLVAAGAPLLAAPWPAAEVLWAAAQPTSFHQAPAGGFSAASIARGQQLYAQHCAACHGADGRGHGPLAAQQPVWPPDLAGPLLWRRADGDLLGHLLAGMRDPRSGRPTMPAFGGLLGDGDAWALIDFMKAQGAGQSLRVAGAWLQPVRLPEMTVRCGAQAPRPLASWQGQRLRLVTQDGAAPLPLEDPRLVTIVLRAPGGPDTAGCVADSSEAWQALALIAGLPAPQRLAGTQFIADRAHWLRARTAPGAAGWTDDDLLCRAGPAPRPEAPPTQDGLGSLIARMDAEPVRLVKGGLVH